MTTSATAETVRLRRSEAETLVCGMPGFGDRDLAFDEPWQIRAFAIAVSAHQSGAFDWATFQGSLISSIQRWEAEADESADADSWSYYEHWVRALEDVLGGAGTMDTAELDQRTQDVLSVPANRGHHQAHLEPVAIDPAVSPGDR